MALLAWILYFPGVHPQPVFTSCSLACKFFTSQPLKRAVRLSVIPATHAAVVSSSTDPPLEFGMSPPLFSSPYQAGAGFADLVPCQAAIPVGSSHLHRPHMVLPLPKPRVQMRHVGQAAALFQPWLSISLPSLVQVQSLRAQLESCRARNESLREAAKSQGDGHVPRGYISQVSRVLDMGPWGCSQSQTGKRWDSAHW